METPSPEPFSNPETGYAVDVTASLGTKTIETSFREGLQAEVMERLASAAEKFTPKLNYEISTSTYHLLVDNQPIVTRCDRGVLLQGKLVGFVFPELDGYMVPEGDGVGFRSPDEFTYGNGAPCMALKTIYDMTTLYLVPVLSIKGLKPQ